MLLQRVWRCRSTTSARWLVDRTIRIEPRTHALDRSRLRQARRLYADGDRVIDGNDLATLAPADIRGSRLFMPKTPHET